MAGLKKYNCQIWFTKEHEIVVEAYSIEEAKAKCQQYIAEKKKPGEKITGRFIHEIERRADDGRE